MTVGMKSRCNLQKKIVSAPNFAPGAPVVIPRLACTRIPSAVALPRARRVPGKCAAPRHAVGSAANLQISAGSVGSGSRTGASGFSGASAGSLIGGGEGSEGVGRTISLNSNCMPFRCDSTLAGSPRQLGFMPSYSDRSYTRYSLASFAGRNLVTFVIFRLLPIAGRLPRENEAIHATQDCSCAPGALCGSGPLSPSSLSRTSGSKSEDSEQSDANLSRFGPQAPIARSRQATGCGCPERLGEVHSSARRQSLIGKRRSRCSRAVEVDAGSA